jgi:hypothetical protein
MHLAINVKSPNNIIKWQMEFNSAFKGLMPTLFLCEREAGEAMTPSRKDIIFFYIWKH